MAEWLKAHAWKACIQFHCIGGSNPPLSINEVGYFFSVVCINLFLNRIVYHGMSIYDEYNLLFYI